MSVTSDFSVAKVSRFVTKDPYSRIQECIFKTISPSPPHIEMAANWEWDLGYTVPETAQVTLKFLFTGLLMLH